MYCATTVNRLKNLHNGDYHPVKGGREGSREQEGGREGGIEGQTGGRFKHAPANVELKQEDWHHTYSCCPNVKPVLYNNDSFVYVFTLDPI